MSIRALSTQLMLVHAYNHASIWQYFMLEIQRQQCPDTLLSPWCPNNCLTAAATSGFAPLVRSVVKHVEVVATQGPSASGIVAMAAGRMLPSPLSSCWGTMVIGVSGYSATVVPRA